MILFIFLLGLLVGAGSVAVVLLWHDIGRARRKTSKLMGEPSPIAPEQIRPPRGACGVSGCPNKRPHSHVVDLANALKRDK